MYTFVNFVCKIKNCTSPESCLVLLAAAFTALLILEVALKIMILMGNNKT